nr:hypothetical protein [Tanacetum cinerariifolium]
MATEGNGDPPVLDLQTMEELFQNSHQFHGLPGDDANKNLDKFLHVTQSIKVNEVTDDALRLYLFPHSLTHHATAWFDRLPRNFINTFEQMAKMFLGKYFPPSMVTKLRNEITNFRQRPDESLFEAWKRYKLSIDQCHNHNMLLVTQIYTFYNGLTLIHHDTINAAAGGTFTKRQIIALKAEMAEVNKNLMKVLQINKQVKAVTHSGETCGGPHSNNDCPATVGQTHNVYAMGAYQGGNYYQPQGNRNLLSYRLENYLGPLGFNQNQNRNNQNQNFQNQNRNQGNNHGIPQGNNQGRNQFFQGASHGQNLPPAYQAPAYQAWENNAILKKMQTNMTSLKNSNLELKNMFGQFMKMNTASSSGSRTLPSNTVTNPKEDLKGITTRSGTAYQGPTIPTTSSSFPKVVERESKVTKDMVPPTNNESTKDANLRFVNALILLPKFGPTIKSLLANKDKLFELAITLLNEHCLVVLLKKLLEKLGDPDKFLIPCDLPGMDECLALDDLDTSINLMPLSVWNKLSFPEISPTLMTLEPADRSISRPIAVTFNLDQTLRYSANYNDMTVNQIDVIDMACEEYLQEVLGFSDVIASGNPTPYYDPIVSTSSLTLTPFGDSDFLLKEVDAFLALENDPTSSEVDHSYYDQVGEILLLEAFLNDDPSLPPPTLKFEKNLKFVKLKMINIQLTSLPSPWLSTIHCVPKEGGFTVVENEENEENELIPTRLVTGWRVYIDYRKLNEATYKDHFPLPFMDQMLERLAGNEYYCFLDGFSGYFQIPIDPKD